MGGALTFFRATATTLTTATARIFARLFAPNRQGDYTRHKAYANGYDDKINRFHAFFLSFLSIHLLYSRIPITTIVAAAAQITNHGVHGRVVGVYQRQILEILIMGVTDL